MKVKNFIGLALVALGGVIMSTEYFYAWCCIVLGGIIYIIPSGNKIPSRLTEGPDDEETPEEDEETPEEKKAYDNLSDESKAEYDAEKKSLKKFGISKIEYLNKKTMHEAEKAKKEADKAEKEDSKKKATSEYKQIEKIDSNLITLMSMDFPKPIEFKNNVFENEKLITDKGGNDVIHKLVKIYTFLDDMWAHLTKVRQEMRDDVEPNSLYTDVINAKERRENRSGEEFFEEAADAFKRASRGDLSALNDSPAATLRRMEETTEMAKDVFPEEIAKVAFIEAMANSMLIFLLADKKLHYFEILEVFDKLGALDSSWQKKAAEHMENIESKLDLLIGGISNLNENIDRLLEKDEEVIKQLQSIDSSIAVNNLLQAITAYQVYK